MNSGLIRGLTTRRVLPVRILIGSMAGLGALVFTMRPVLMGEIWRRAVIHGDLKLAMRRLAWYGRKSPFQIEVVKDPLFNFTEGLSNQELLAVRSFIENRTLADVDRILDRLTLTAAEVTETMSPMVWADIIDRFSSDVDTLLDLLPRASNETHVKDSLPKANKVFSRQLARQALGDFAALFPVDRLPWFVISGTFLGLVREGGFLDHDYDIDLGIDAADADLDAIIDGISGSDNFRLGKIDYLKTLSPRKDGGCDLVVRPILVKIRHQNGVAVDLFMHYSENDISWHGSSVHRWENSSFDLTGYTLEGIPVLGPADADRYLSENYGDWRTPVTDFRCYTGTSNVWIVRNLASIALFLRRLAFARLNHDFASHRLEEILVNSGFLTCANGRLRFARDSLA